MSTHPGLALLWQRSLDYRPAFFSGCGATIGLVAMRLALPWPLRALMEMVFSPGGEPDAVGPVTSFTAGPLILFCGAYLVLSLATGLFEMAQRVSFAKFSTGTVHAIRREAMTGAGRIVAAHPGKGADLITRVIGDSARLKSDLQGILVHASQNTLLILAVVTLFLVLAPKLGVLFLMGAASAVLIGFLTVEEVAETALRQRSKESRYATLLGGGTGHLEEEFAEEDLNESSAKKDVHTTRIIARSSVLAHGAMAAMVTLALWVGVRGVRAGSIAPGELFLFVAYALIVHRRAVRVGRQTARSGKILATSARIASLIGGHDPVPGLDPLSREIRLEEIRLASPPPYGKRPRLGPLSLSIAAGTKVLVLGGAGAGKSSLLALIAGNEQPDGGMLLWDDLDITRAQQRIAATVAYAGQRPLLGRRSVREILGLAHDAMPTPEKEEMLQNLGVAKMIRRFRRGLNQMVSTGDLSPRQLRSLSLAAAVLSNSGVWVIDEPVETAGGGSRRRLQLVLEKAAGRTLIVGMRHPCLIEQFDRVIALHRGRITFDGTPPEWLEWSRTHKKSRHVQEA